MPAAKPFHHQRARELRAAGWSLRRIAAELGVALSSVSVWVRDVERPPIGKPPEPEREGPGDEPARRCSRCRRTLPLTSFNRYRDRHQWWCRECFQSNYRRNRARQLGRANELKRWRVAEARAWAVAHLRAHACVDCEIDEPLLLEFDHVGAKRAAIATLVSRGINLVALALEIEQCEVVCANCHRRRTARRAGWSRGRPEPYAAGSRHRGAARARNVAYAYRILHERGCVDCGERDLCVLDFDHVGEKTQTVMRLAWQEVSLCRIQAEIERCEVRCTNCHRRRTATRVGYYRVAA